MNSSDHFNISKDLYGFSLYKLTSIILWRLTPLDMCYQVWSNNIDHYLQILLHDQPRYILGKGTYLGEDQDVIKIETLAKNQFRNAVIDKEFPASYKIRIKPFIKPVSQTDYASKLENSFCNFISWKIVRLIEMEKLQSRYTFLHIPKSFSATKALGIIELMINIQVNSRTGGNNSE